MTIDSFFGKYRFLSNFYPSVLTISVNRKLFTFDTVEHAYQGFKSTSLTELALFSIENGLTPGEAKKLGRSVKMREDWDTKRDLIMRTLLDLKFNPDIHPELHHLLMQTGSHELIEGNTWGDKYWGVCEGVGKNKLGKMLMDIRDLYAFDAKFSD